MRTIKFTRFTKVRELERIGRELLARFLDRFKEELAEQQVELPPVEMADKEYFKALAVLFKTPAGLPVSLNEALSVIIEMGNEEGEERLRQGIALQQLDLRFDEKATRSEIALRVWLDAPTLLAEKHSEMRLVRLTSFVYFGTKVPPPERVPFQPLTVDQLRRLTGDLDAWFTQEQRGHETTEIDAHAMDGEWWFMIRHGDAYTRTATVGPQAGVLHYQPATDDVVVYSPEREDIRINAKRERERQLYRQALGRHLYGNPEYFSEKKAYTLDPLRLLGVDALDTAGIEGLTKIVLREMEVAWNNPFKDVTVYKSEDLFASAEHRMKAGPIPNERRLLKAVFDVHFKDAKKPRKVTVKPPNVLKLGRHCDAHLAHRWLTLRGFRDGVHGKANNTSPWPSPQRGEGITKAEGGSSGNQLRVDG